MLHYVYDVRVEVDAARCSILNSKVYGVESFPTSVKMKKRLFFVFRYLESGKLSSDFQVSDRMDDKNSK